MRVRQKKIQFSPFFSPQAKNDHADKADRIHNQYKRVGTGWDAKIEALRKLLDETENFYKEHESATTEEERHFIERKLDSIEYALVDAHSSFKNISSR